MTTTSLAAIPLDVLSASWVEHDNLCCCVLCREMDRRLADLDVMALIYPEILTAEFTKEG